MWDKGAWTEKWAKEAAVLVNWIQFLIGKLKKITLPASVTCVFGGDRVEVLSQGARDLSSIEKYQSFGLFWGQWVFICSSYYLNSWAVWIFVLHLWASPRKMCWAMFVWWMKCMTQVLGVPLLLVISSELSAIKEGGKCSEHWTVTEAGISCRGRKRSSPLFWTLLICTNWV
jgi:hypothetical protein